MVEDKRCSRCKPTAPLFTCRNCGRKTCEHLCGYKVGATAMCQTCQRIIAQNWWKDKK